MDARLRKIALILSVQDTNKSIAKHSCLLKSLVFFPLACRIAVLCYYSLNWWAMLITLCAVYNGNCEIWIGGTNGQ